MSHQQGLAEKAPQVKAVIRVMPNTPALVGAGCAGLLLLTIKCPSKQLITYDL